MKKALAAAAMVLTLAACGNPSDVTDGTTGQDVDGFTQVFNIDTPTGKFQCISWKDGYGGGLDCEPIK